MSTLISVGGNSGETGRCDAKCYEAQHPDCDCVCGGINHGKGLMCAQANAQEIAQEVLSKYPDKKVVFPEQQFELFNQLCKSKK